MKDILFHKSFIEGIEVYAKAANDCCTCPPNRVSAAPRPGWRGLSQQGGKETV